jgi:hypothetical protein
MPGTSSGTVISVRQRELCNSLTEALRSLISGGQSFHGRIPVMTHARLLMTHADSLAAYGSNALQLTVLKGKLTDEQVTYSSTEKCQPTTDGDGLEGPA